MSSSGQNSWVVSAWDAPANAKPNNVALMRTAIELRGAAAIAFIYIDNADARIGPKSTHIRRGWRSQSDKTCGSTP